jgi:hypothetical protein
MDYFRNRSGAARIRLEIDIMQFRVACGRAVGIGDISRKEWENPGRALVPPGIQWSEGMFAVRSRGSSMQPKIRNRMWCLFHPDVVGTRQHRLVLVEDRRQRGDDQYTLKKYFSHKRYSANGTWEHDEIWLLPLHPGHKPWRLENDGAYRICGWFVGAVPRIHRIHRMRYRYVPVE